MAAPVKKMRLPPLPTIQEIIRIYKLRAKKQLSQNFLLDMNLTRKIVRKAGKIEGGHVVEVGPGPGGITRALIQAKLRHLSVVEKDSRFLPSLQILKEASLTDNMTIYNDDILRFKMDDIFDESLRKEWHQNPPNIHLIGNLPFNVSTPLIIKWLEEISNRDGAWQYGRVRMTLTFQKEVAERMSADILDRQRCRLSVMCQYLCDVRHIFTIPGKAFVPAPEVDVGVVHFIPRRAPLIDQPFKMVEKVVRHIFHYRQKMCKHGIQTLFPHDRPDLALEMIRVADIDPTMRPFQIHMDEFERLCMAYKHVCDSYPEMFGYDFRSQRNAEHWRTFVPAIHV